MLIAGGFQRHPLYIAIFHMDADEVLGSIQRSDIIVRPVEPSNAKIFGQIFTEWLGIPVASPWLPAFAIGQPGTTPYIAYNNSKAIGAAALFIDGDWRLLFIAQSDRPIEIMALRLPYLPIVWSMDGRRACARSPTWLW